MSFITPGTQQPGHRQGATLFASDWRVTLHHRARTFTHFATALPPSPIIVANYHHLAVGSMEFPY
jgi:hypothetical protein